jgi:hypothetical protein
MLFLHGNAKYRIKIYKLNIKAKLVNFNTVIYV